MRTTRKNTEPGSQPDPFLRTNVRSAVWNAVVAIAIVFIMFVTFYGISSERQQTASAPPVTATPAEPPSTTGQGGAQGDAQKQPDQGAQKQDEPKAPATGEDQPKQ